MTDPWSFTEILARMIVGGLMGFSAAYIIDKLTRPKP